MSIAVVRKLLEARVASELSSLPTAWENVPFDPPENSPWQQVNLLPADPETPALGDGYYRERGVLQILLLYPENTGPGAAQTAAEGVRTAFPRGLTLTEGTLRVKLLRPATIAPAANLGGWYQIPVSVPYIAEVFA